MALKYEYIRAATGGGVRPYRKTRYEFGHSKEQRPTDRRPNSRPPRIEQHPGRTPMTLAATQAPRVMRILPQSLWRTAPLSLAPALLLPRPLQRVAAAAAAAIAPLLPTQLCRSRSSPYSYSNSLQSPKLILVIGGPGSGKGTQCSLLQSEFGLAHISTGQLLRDAASGLSPVIRQKYPDERIASSQTEARRRHLAEIMDRGLLVPDPLVLGLLSAHLDLLQSNVSGILLDGYPRTLPQAKAFVEKIGKPDIVLYLECSDDILADRLLMRGRADDSKNSITERLRQYRRDFPAIIKYFEDDLSNRASINSRIHRLNDITTSKQHGDSKNDCNTERPVSDRSGPCRVIRVPASLPSDQVHMIVRQHIQMDL